MNQPVPNPPPVTVRHPYTGLTLRSACFGLALSALINIAAPYSKHFLRSTYLASDFMPLGLVFPFLLLVTLINGTLKALPSSWGLTRPELIVVFAMGLVATITSPFYYATSENGVYKNRNTIWQY